MNDKIAGVLVVGDREDVDAPKGRRRGDHVGGRVIDRESQRDTSHGDCLHAQESEIGAGGRDVTLDDLSGMIKDLDSGRLDRWSIANQDTCSKHANKGKK